MAPRAPSSVEGDWGVVIELPDPPLGSRIAVERGGEAVRLSWPGRPWARGRVADALDLAAIALACGLAAAHAIWMLGSLVSLPLGGSSATLIHLPVSAVFIWAAWTMARNRRRYRSSERLVLDDSFVVHCPVRRVPLFPLFPYADVNAFVEELAELSQDARGLLPRGACAFLRKADVKDIAVEGKGAFGVVSIKAGDYDVDVGRRLGEVEREWLVELLRRWKANG